MGLASTQTKTNAGNDSTSSAAAATNGEQAQKGGMYDIYLDGDADEEDADKNSVNRPTPLPTPTPPSKPSRPRDDQKNAPTKQSVLDMLYGELDAKK